MSVPTSITQYDRREFLTVAGGAIAGLTATCAMAARDGKNQGLVVSQPEAAAAGLKVLADGGNAVDAAVAAALAGCVVNISHCGIGGYGGHMVIGWPDGESTAIDFNSTAPAAARPDMFPLNPDGTVKGMVNKHGWLAAGVPGTMAGLHLALIKHGKLSWDQVLKPAIRWARQGFELQPPSIPWQSSDHANVSRDSSFARLFLRDGKTLRRGDIFRNPALADMLQQLAESGSVDAFYRGKIGKQIAQAFQNNGGLVTAEDMAAYQAPEVTPLELESRGHRIVTAPLTAGGLSVLQAISALEALDWVSLPERPLRTQAWLEALRIAWGDRLSLFGDPQQVDVPIKRLLSEQYAEQSAEKIRMAIAEGRPVAIASDGRTSGGTLHVSAVDATGMMASITLTHGDSFGAQVAVEGLGLILGHGMSRFDPMPGLPNSVAPGKRPLNNMCPMIVFRGGRPVMTLGAVGGRRIPNAVFQVLLGVVGEGRSLAEAERIPRLHTEGGIELHAEPRVAKVDLKHLEKVGYVIKPPLGVSVFAAELQSVPNQAN